MTYTIPMSSFETPSDFDQWAAVHEGEYEYAGDDVILFDDEEDHFKWCEQYAETLMHKNADKAMMLQTGSHKNMRVTKTEDDQLVNEMLDLCNF